MRGSSSYRLHGCRNPNYVPSLRFMFVGGRIVPVVGRLQPSQLPSLSSFSGTMRYPGVTVFRHNSDIVVDTAAPEVTLYQPRVAEVSSAFVLALYGCRNPIDVWQSSLSPLTRGLFRSRWGRIRWLASQLASLSSFASVCTLAAFRRM